MTNTAVESFRVACDDYAFNRTPSYTAALRAKFDVERREDTCPGEHRVEGLVDGEWLPAHEAVARVALTAKVGTVVETLDGPLTKHTGSWSPETAARVPLTV